MIAVLVLHIASGFVAMLGGLVPLLVRRGGAAHRRWGRVFVGAMFVAGTTAFPLALRRADGFQAALGLLALYGTWLGLRTGRRDAPTAVDATLTLLAALGFVALLATVPGTFVHGDAATGRAALGFGGFGLALALRDLLGFARRDRTVPRRLVDHVLATTLALVVAWSSFLNTQTLRLTGLILPIDLRMLPPIFVALPLLAVGLPRWSRRLRERGLQAWEGGRETSEIERLRGLGLAEGVSFLLLLFVAVPLKRLAGEPGLVRALGPVHGGLVVLYAVSVLLAARALRWSVPRTLGTLGAAVVPFGTFVVEARLRREAR